MGVCGVIFIKSSYGPVPILFLVLYRAFILVYTYRHISEEPP